MDRKQFLSEMKKGLFETIKEVSSPFVEEKLEKVDAAMENLTGVHWTMASGVTLPLRENHVQDITLARLPIMIAQVEGTRICILKQCKQCGSFLNYIVYRNEMKCLSCDTSYPLVKDEEKHLEFLHSKIEGGFLWIALPIEKLK